MKKIKLLILFLTSIIIVKAGPSLKIETKYENNTEGLVYKDIKMYKFYKENETNNISTNLDFGFNKYLFINGKINKNNKNKNTNYSLGLKVNTPEIKGVKFSYSLKNYIGNDYIDQKRSTTNINTFEVSFKDVDSKIELENFEDINFEINHKNFEFGLNKIHNVEKQLKDMRNLQNEIKIVDDDGHGHNHKLGTFSSLDYNIKNVEDAYDGKYTFNNYRLQFTINKDNRFNKKIAVNTKLKYDFKNIYSNVANKLNFETQKHNLIVSTTLHNSNPKNLNYEAGAEFEYTNISQKILKDVNLEKLKADELGDIRPGYANSFRPKLLTNETHLGLDRLEYSILGNINYTYLPIDNLEFTFGINSKLSLIQQKNKVNQNILDRYKKANDDEISRAKNVRENLTEEELKERNNKISKFENEIKEFNGKLEEFNLRTDFNKEIDNYYDLQNKRTNKRNDLEEISNKFKEVIKGMNPKEIDKLFKEKNSEFLILEKQNGITPKNYRDFSTTLIDNTNKKIEKIIKASKEHNINNPEEFAKKYVELSEYRSSGYYSGAKNSIFNEENTIKRQKTSKEKELRKLKNEIYPDDTILKNYITLLNDTKFSYKIKADVEPFMNIEYNITDYLTISGRISSNIELEKEFKENSKFKNHIDFNSNISMTYLIK